MQKHAVVVSRQWQKPEISIDVTDDEIRIAMSLPAFLDALAAEIGNPALVLTQAQLLAKLRAAAEAVVREMKSQTTRVM